MTAEAAAERAFTEPKSLPFDAEGADATGLAEEGRRRLKGAFLIAIDRIAPDPDQPRKRIDPAYLEELTASIKRLGILQPITVRYVEEIDKYRIIAGECRFTAAGRAGLKELPCWVRTPKAEEILLHQIIENWQRSDLNPFELADSLAHLRDANGYSQRDLAEATGKSPGEISKILTILELDPEVQKVARDDTAGRITKRHLYPLARLDAAAQLRLIDRIAKEDLTAVDTERLVARMEARVQENQKPGAPVSRRKFLTKYGSLLFTFRKRDVTHDDLLAVLKEVKEQIEEQASDAARLN